MLRRPPRRALALVLAGALAVTGALTLEGCTLARNVVDRASGGSVDIGGSQLPEGFPAEQVPLVEGEIVFGTGVKNSAGRGWNVSVAVTGPSAWEQVEHRLVRAGYAESEQKTGTDGASGVFDKQPYHVAVLIARQDDSSDWTATYTVRTGTPTPTTGG